MQNYNNRKLRLKNNLQQKQKVVIYLDFFDISEASLVNYKYCLNHSTKSKTAFVVVLLFFYTDNLPTDIFGDEKFCLVIISIVNGP